MQLLLLLLLSALLVASQALSIRCPPPSTSDTLPPTMCCSNVTQACNLTSNFVSPFVLNVTSLNPENATLIIAPNQTLSIGGLYAEGQPSFFSGSIVVQAKATLWMGRVALTVGGKQLIFEPGSTLRITGNGTILLSNQTCLSMGANVTLIVDLDGNETLSTPNTTAPLPVIQTLSNETALCFSVASEANTFGLVNASYSIINAQSGTTLVVWTSLGTGCSSYSSLAAVFTAAGCAPPPRPPPPPPPLTIPPLVIVVVVTNPDNTTTLVTVPAPSDDTTTTTNTTMGGEGEVTTATTTINGLWVVAGSVMGAIFLLLVVAGLLFVYNPRFRRFLAPFRDRSYFVSTIERAPRVNDRRRPREGDLADA